MVKQPLNGENMQKSLVSLTWVFAAILGAICLGVLALTQGREH